MHFRNKMNADKSNNFELQGGRGSDQPKGAESGAPPEQEEVAMMGGSRADDEEANFIMKICESEIVTGTFPSQLIYSF